MGVSLYSMHDRGPKFLGSHNVSGTAVRQEAIELGPVFIHK